MLTQKSSYFGLDNCKQFVAKHNSLIENGSCCDSATNARTDNEVNSDWTIHRCEQSGFLVLALLLLVHVFFGNGKLSTNSSPSEYNLGLSRTWVIWKLAFFRCVRVCKVKSTRDETRGVVGLYFQPEVWLVIILALDQADLWRCYHETKLSDYLLLFGELYQFKSARLGSLSLLILWHCT